MYIEEWQWDDGNLDHLAEHGVTRHIVEQVSLTAPRFRPNPRRLPHGRQMIGPDYGGGMWLICIVPIQEHPGLWRAYTGWPAEPEDEKWYRRST